MKNTYPFIVAVASAMVLSGCGNPSDTPKSPSSMSAPSTHSTSKESAPPVANTADAIAIVNGKPITKSALEVIKAEISQRRGGTSIPDDKILDEMIKRELLRQEAETGGLGKDPKMLAKIENAQRMVLSQAAAEQFMNAVQLTDDELKKEYEQRIGPMKGTEFKARHILVDSEATAKDIIAKLQKGEKFEELAKKFSKDPGSKDNAGDLGWFNPQQMVPAFSEAVVALKNGETTQAPVQSQFGWHIIQREDSREQAAPSFDAVKEQLRPMLQTQKLQQHVKELEAKAKIENRLPPPPPKPVSPSEAPSAPDASNTAPAPANESKPADKVTPASNETGETSKPSPSSVPSAAPSPSMKAEPNAPKP